MNPSFLRSVQPDLAEKYNAEDVPELWNHSLSASILLRSVLQKDELELIWLDTPFRLDPHLEVLKLSFIDFLVSQGSQDLTNGSTVRLQNAELLVDGHVRLTIQDGTYFDYLLTNWAASQNYGVKNETGDVIALRDMVEPGPRLTPLPMAKAANHTGVVCLYLCEGQLLINQRGRQITDAGMWGLSASGTLENDGPNTSPFHHILVELAEETGLADEFVDHESLRLIGIAREFHRAGKPEMYFAVRGRRSLADTKALVARRTGVDAWEAVRSDWVPLSAENQWQQLKDRQLQPSARIGLWFLLQWLQSGFDSENR